MSTIEITTRDMPKKSSSFFLRRMRPSGSLRSSTYLTGQRQYSKEREGEREDEEKGILKKKIQKKEETDLRRYWLCTNRGNNSVDIPTQI